MSEYQNKPKKKQPNKTVAKQAHSEKHSSDPSKKWRKLSAKWGKRLLIVLLVLVLIAGGVFTAWSKELSQVKITADNFMDVGRLYPRKVVEIRHETSEEALVKVVKEAQAKQQKISIAGSQHSQGGHTYYDDAIVLNMKDYDRILGLDPDAKLLTVQSGATWQDVQAYLQPKGLAVKVMQSSYIFTIGGTLSANAHGRDLDRGSVVETVRSFRLLKADGSIVTVSKTENPDLFKLVIGGYGMFGVILDVTLEVTDDVLYEKKSANVGYRDFPTYFDSQIKSDPNAKMMLVRPNVDVKSDQFLKDFVVSVWSQAAHNDKELFTLKEEKNILRDKLFFDLSRRYDWAKSLRWSLQQGLVEKGGDQFISRNNAMRPPEAPLAFLDYYPKNRTDIIQEYYVPKTEFVAFMDKFRNIIVKDDVNIISSTIRYVKAGDESYLSYAPKEDAFSIIVMSNIGRDKTSITQAQATTRKLVDASIAHRGTYYLTYQLFPSIEQMKTAYPNADYVFAQKKVHDPSELFMSEFYQQYGQGKVVEYGDR